MKIGIIFEEYVCILKWNRCSWRENVYNGGVMLVFNYINSIYFHHKGTDNVAPGKVHVNDKAPCL